MFCIAYHQLMRKHPRRPTTNPRLAVAYLRVSTEDQQLGPDAQRAAIEAWSRRAGVEVVAWHEDRLSGATPVEDRPGLLDALASLREREAGILVAGKRDRIARDVVVAATVERLAADAGARVVTADGVTADDTPEGALLRGLLDLFASYERSMIRSRTRAALRVRRERGEVYTRTAPLGYRFEDGRMTLDAGEQADLARIRDMRARGLSLATVARTLNATGSNCRGGRWHVTTLRRALAREAA